MIGLYEGGARRRREGRRQVEKNWDKGREERVSESMHR